MVSLWWAVFPMTAFALMASIYIVKQWEKGVVMRFGQIVKVADSGLRLKIPFIDSVRKVDLRMDTSDLTGQVGITKDNISVSIDAVVFMKVEDPEKMITQVVDYWDAVSKYAQTTIRNVVGEYKLDELLQKREAVANTCKEIVDELAKKWGIDIARIELQHISLPEDMKRAFAVQAEAEREAKAVVIKARAELEAAEQLAEAAHKLGEQPGAMQLRTLSTINDISKDQSNTIILALPLDTLKGLNAGDIGALSSIKSKFEKS